MNEGTLCDKSDLSYREVTLWILAAILIASLQLLSLLNSGGDLAGHDYAFFIPRLLDGLLFFKAQGFSIPWYSPSFCGGLPYFPDPQSMYYSFPQFLAFLVSPWIAIQITAVLMLSIGSISMWYLCRKVFAFSLFVSLIGMLAFLGNGFFMARMNIGHLSYHSYPLIITLLYLVLDRKVPSRFAIGASGLTLGYFAHSGFHMAPFIVPLALLLTILLLFSVRPSDEVIAPREVTLRTFSALLLGGLIGSPKLYSSFRFLENFPREKAFDSVDTIWGATKLIFSNLFLPGSYEPFSWSSWEYDYSVSPCFILPLLSAFYLLLRGRTLTSFPRNSAQKLSFTLLCILLFMCFLFAANPWRIADFLKSFPLLTSFRINMRISGALLVLTILLSCFALSKISSIRLRRLLLMLFFVTCFVPGERIRLTGMNLFSSYYTFSLPNAADLHKQISVQTPADMQVNAVRNLHVRGMASQVNLKHFAEFPHNFDLVGMNTHISNSTCYFPLFEEYPFSLKDGPIRKTTDGNFNFINPSCYVFSVENICSPGNFIRVNDEANLSQLLLHKNPQWKLPTIVSVIVYGAFLSLLICMFYVIFYFKAFFRVIVRALE